MPTYLQSPGAALDADEDMAWTEPGFSIQEVNAAGKALVKYFTDEDEKVRSYSADDWRSVSKTFDTINNWRASHSYPLNTFQMNLRNAAKRFDSGALVAQRIKRMMSIGDKLIRSPSMKLSQMQDIGGCRAVVSTVGHVRSIVDYYENSARIKHTLGVIDDYIATPKGSGYRGVHLIFKYASDKKTTYNNMKIEMQVRSRYQHAWATTVETAGLFMGQALKTSIGNDDWLRFFALMGSAIALRERCQTVPGTPDDKTQLIQELRHYAHALDVSNRLKGYANALRYIQSDVEDAHWYLLRLNPGASELTVTGFKMREREEAEAQYAKAEESMRSSPGTDAVLVSVESAVSLPRAYPNYFADTGVFVELLQQALSRKVHRIRPTKIKATQLPLPDIDSN